MKDYSVDGPVYLGELIEMLMRVMGPARIFYVDLRDIHGPIIDHTLLMCDSEVERFYNYKILDADFEEDYYCFNITLLSPDEQET